MRYTPTDIAGVVIVDIAPLMRCTHGAIVDVAVDVRPGSRTYRKHGMVQLSAENPRALFLPPYVAHGFQTLAQRLLSKDSTLTYDDVVLPAGRLLDQLIDSQRRLDVGIPLGLMANV